MQMKGPTGRKESSRRAPARAFGIPSRASTRGAILSVVVQGQFVLLQFGGAVLLARWLGPTAYGVYSFTWAIIMLAQVVPVNGLENLSIRFTAAYRASGSLSLMSGLWRALLTSSIGYGLIAALAIIAVGCLLPSGRAYNSTAMLAAAAPLALLPLMDTLGATLRASHPGVLGQLPHYLVRPLAFLVIVGCFAVGLFPARLSPAIALFSQGAAAACAVMAALLWLGKSEIRSASEVPPRYEIRTWAQAVVPLTLVAGMMLINNQADLLILGLVRTAKETGVYRVAVQVANLVALTLTAANLFIAPRIAERYAKADIRGLQRMLEISTATTFSCALAVAVVFWALGRWIMSTVFGTSYSSGYLPLAILCLAQLVNVGAGSVATALNMTGHERDAMRAAGLSALANIAMNVVLIPQYGMVGAATATAITTALWNGGMAYLLWRRTGILAPVFAGPIARRIRR